MKSIRRRDKRGWYLLFGIFVMVASFSFLSNNSHKASEDVKAASLANFDPGYIISDYTMGNYNSMTEAEIQAFLNTKGNCRDTRIYLADIYTGYSYHIKDGHFVCLAEETFGDGVAYGEDAPGGESAAHVIWQAAQDYRINPQVLIVLLQKEQGLITDSWPNNRQFKVATGYGCPDTAPCAEQYFGFKNQVRKAAAMFRTVLDGGWTNYPLGENYIQYNPSVECGGSVVNIRSLATSALYRYTPYQPNPGAIAAGYGTAYCGAYGNRNFYLYFEDWFSGITVEGGWNKMINARTMKITENTNAINPINGSSYEGTLEAGERYYFTTKIDVVVNGKREACLRTEEDSNNNVDKCIPISKMADAGDVSYTIEVFEPIVLSVIKDTYKYNLKTGKKVQSIQMTAIPEISFSGKIQYNGKTYYQTTYDHRNGNEYFIPAEDLKGIMFTNFLYPRNMEIKSDTEFINLQSGEVCKEVKAGYVRRFTTKVDLDDGTYYRTEEDTNSSTMCAIPANKVKEATSWNSGGELSFQNFLYPRKLRINKFTYLVDLSNGTSCEKNYSVDEEVMFTTKITVNGVNYYRSEEDTSNNSFCAVPSKFTLEL